MELYIGDKTKPFFLLSFSKNLKSVSIYKPDSISSRLEFLEKYSLGKMVKEFNVVNILFLKNNPVKYPKGGQRAVILDYVILQTTTGFFLINDKITKLKTK